MTPTPILISGKGGSQDLAIVLSTGCSRTQRPAPRRAEFLVNFRVEFLAEILINFLIYGTAIRTPRKALKT